ncbi:MAG TPA: DUF222 domain-containing protein, partial [Egibacteraceae bacterium]|nr:DUF222 domain-containing protein [Egibacteraceae bacterium]
RARPASGLAARCRMTPGQAASAAQSARRLAALPRTPAGVVAGTVGAAQARVAAAALRDLPADAAAGLDDLVANSAAGTDPVGLRRALDDYAHRVCADSLAERERRAREHRRLSLSRTADGAVTIDGRLDPVGGETVLSALAALAAPAGGADRRLPEQRNADALVALAGRALDSGDLPEVGGQRPHVTVVVGLENLKRADGAPPAALDRFGAVSGEAARRLACDAAVTRVVTAGASQVLDAGRATRVVSVAQRRALAVRDGGCVGCRAPVAWCDAHHVVHWADGGATDVENLVLLCSGCHGAVHERGRRVSRGPDGRWALRPPGSDLGRAPPHPR